MRAILLGAGLLCAGSALADYEGLVAVGATAVDRPYAGASTDVSPTLLLIGQWRNVYFAGDRILVGLHDGGWWTAAAVAQYRYHQYQSPDRDRAVELGAAFTFPVGDHYLQVSAVHDVTGAHEGMETEVRAFTRIVTGRFVFVPALAVQHQDGRLADHYFGMPAYAPGSTTNLTGELTVIAAVNGPWVVAGSSRITRHGNAIAGSPAVTGRNTTTWTLALGRNF